MKFLVLLLASVALASASFVGGKYTDIKEDGTFNQKNKYGLEFFGKYFRGQDVYGHDYNVDYFYNVLMKIFDRQVLKTAWTQEQTYNQDMYGQYSYEKMWDMVFTHEGIFDYQYLVEILNNDVLRNYFVQQGFFDVAVLDQILVSYKTEGVYDQYLLQHLFNTQVLKYFFTIHRISVYDILGQASYNKYYGNTFFNKYYGNNFYNKGVYGYNMLEKIISQPICRNLMVQYGIFNKNILDQILYWYNTQGVYDQVLLRQLVNKQALYKVLAQYGMVDQTVLKQYVDNEYLGLNYLYKNNFFERTPTVDLFGANGNVPEYTNNMQMYRGNSLKNMWYGQQYYGYNQGPYSYYSKYYHQYPLTQQVY